MYICTHTFTRTHSLYLTLSESRIDLILPRIFHFRMVLFMGAITGMETDNEGGEGGEREAVVDYFYVLPEGCIADIVSLTSPRDACRLCMVSTTLRSVAESDTVWERFLPPDYLSVVSPHSLPCTSKKDLFFSLCDRPLLIEQGTKSFSLEKESGKKCYMLSARALSIVWGDTPRYWRWVPLPESRFEDVAELISVCWFEICGNIDIRMLSPSTLYTANLVFKSTMGAYGFEHLPVEATIGLVGGETSMRSVYLDAERGRRLRYRIVPRRLGLYIRNRTVEYETEAPPPREADNDQKVQNHPKERGDGWLEIELGEFFYDGRQEGELEIKVSEVTNGDWKGGLIVQGIEIRPKKG
ncbi:putative F-box protein PP2-B12 [Morus notabilis]|uniref:putative F-box protein PP2-B12 n=1 Tax=Morus notabilis TaxID=981085 RepID=UPI000CED4158|nr:putative F-box protein PP2-B12 [Morus notabilis]